MKQLFEYAALLLVSFVAAALVGWLAADAVQHVFAVINTILASV